MLFCFLLSVAYASSFHSDARRAQQLLFEVENECRQVERSLSPRQARVMLAAAV
jgi:hypothetical protein